MSCKENYIRNWEEQHMTPLHPFGSWFRKEALSEKKASFSSVKYEGN